MEILKYFDLKKNNAFHLIAKNFKSNDFDFGVFDDFSKIENHEERIQLCQDHLFEMNDDDQTPMSIALKSENILLIGRYSELIKMATEQ